MRALGIILAGGNNNRMRELSNKRAIDVYKRQGKTYLCAEMAGKREATGDHLQLQTERNGNSGKEWNCL